MEDPGAKLTRWLPAIAPVALAVVVAVGVATVSAWGAVVGGVLTVASLLVVVIAGIVFAAYLWLAAEDYRRKEGYVVCEADYADAPRQIKATMRRIYRSARAVRVGRAHQDGMFGELELDRLVFAAAEQAILSSEVAAGVRDLKPDAQESDRELIAVADTQIKAITEHLVEVERTLKRSASTADHLSKKIAEPEKRWAEQKAADEARTAAQDRRRRAREKLEEATVEAKAKVPVEAADIEERIAAVATGYDEVTQVSGGEEGEKVDSPSHVSSTDEDPKAVGPAAIRAAKYSAVQATKRSSGGVRKLKKLLDENTAAGDQRNG
ncbi:Uncharacterised protein [Mycolicibacterium smegmatis]|nr:Uncharacterised protein [Mycolicibacterium smegmatis]